MTTTLRTDRTRGGVVIPERSDDTWLAIVSMSTLGKGNYSICIIDAHTGQVNNRGVVPPSEDAESLDAVDQVIAWAQAHPDYRFHHEPAGRYVLVVFNGSIFHGQPNGDPFE